jgi:putative addiction module component (TIGR02574 family)
MDRDVQSLIQDGLELTPEDRVKVAGALLESVPDENVAREWREEIQYRLEEYRRGEGVSLTREESMADARQMIEAARKRKV